MRRRLIAASALVLAAPFLTIPPVHAATGTNSRNGTYKARPHWRPKPPPIAPSQSLTPPPIVSAPLPSAPLPVGGGTEQPPTGTATVPLYTQPVTDTASDYAARLLRAVNAERAKAGVPALARGLCLNDAAQSWAPKMASSGTLTHQSLNNLAACPGVAAVGENIARSNGTPEQVVAAWMASTIGHRSNMLDPTYTHAGIGAARGADGLWYVVNTFGTYW